MIRVIRTSTAPPRTQTVIRAGDITVPWTMPTEREQRRRLRDYAAPIEISMEGDA